MQTSLSTSEKLSLVGESGSGKTTIGRAIIGLNDNSKGPFDGRTNGKNHVNKQRN